MLHVEDFNYLIENQEQETKKEKKSTTKKKKYIKNTKDIGNIEDTEDIDDVPNTTKSTNSGLIIKFAATWINNKQVIINIVHSLTSKLREKKWNIKDCCFTIDSENKNIIITMNKYSKTIKNNVKEEFWTNFLKYVVPTLDSPKLSEAALLKHCFKLE